MEKIYISEILRCGELTGLFYIIQCYSKTIDHKHPNLITSTRNTTIGLSILLLCFSQNYM